MKNKIILLASTLLLGALETQAQTLYPGLTAVNREYTAIKVSNPPSIDGVETDAAWSGIPWRQAAAIAPFDTNSWPTGTTPVAPEGPFSGAADIDVKFKMVWDDGYYYLLLRYKDDKVIYSDNHDGYRTGAMPASVTAALAAAPIALGATNGSFSAFRMDMLAIWLTPHTDALQAGGGFARNQNSLNHNFFMGQINLSTNPDSVLWAPKHFAPGATTNLPQTHEATVAGRYDTAEQAYYIEFRDETWDKLFNSVRTKVTGQKLYGPTVRPAVGDKFLMQGEINDADGNQNRRDYVNYFASMNPATISPTQNLSEAIVITLGGALGLNEVDAKNSLQFYIDASNKLRFTKNVDVEIYNTVGQRVIQSKNASEINVASLAKGVYVVKEKSSNAGKFIKK
jgi:hypothetical protein